MKAGMLKSVLALALFAQVFLVPPIHAAPVAVTSTLLAERVQLGVDYFAREQAADGSWTKLIIVSSVMYNTHMIFLYEFLNRTTEKKEIIDGLMRYVWAQQNADGGLPGYTGGPSNASISVLAYLAGKIAGEDDDSFRMLGLETYIKKTKATKHAGSALPYLMIFELDRNYNCMGGLLQSLLLSFDKQLPWVKVVLYPLMHLFSTGQTHRLQGSKFPTRLARGGFCPRWWPHPFRRLKIGEKKFWRWLDTHMNEDGTLFDYTPTSVPGLMALATGGPRRAALLEKGIQTLESFQTMTPQGLYQSPGEASIGETNGVLNSLLEMGYTEKDPMVQRAEKFLYDVQQVKSGAFGFSKHNLHFPDTDDTSNSIYVLTRLAKLRGQGQRGARPISDLATEQRLDRALNWLVSVQNRDGGFGTWEKNRFSILNHFAKKSGLVLSESVTEHTARIVVMLAEHRARKPQYQKAYDRAMKYLLKRQLKDGSYPGTWFVDYLFGTSMVMAAFGTSPGDMKLPIERGLQFILSRQNADGGFSESPASFVQGKSIPLLASSPAQTGLIVSQLLTFLREENGVHNKLLQPMLERAIQFLVVTQQADGLWHDATWTGVTFPKVEYLIYPYIQEVGPLQALGMYRLMFLDAANGTGRP